MTLLVGDNTTQTGTFAANNDLLYFRSNATAVATGTASTAWIRISSEGASTSFKICVYNGSTGALLATSSSITAAAGWVSGSISVSITSGNSYALGVISTGGTGFTPFSDSSTWNADTDNSGTYASPPSTTTVFTDGNGGLNVGNMSIYLDGSTGGGSVALTGNGSTGAGGTLGVTRSVQL